MCKNTLSALQLDASTAKRAQYEAFDFEFEAPGIVTVRNESHENTDEHSYRVNVESGVPVACDVRYVSRGCVQAPCCYRNAGSSRGSKMSLMTTGISSTSTLSTVSFPLTSDDRRLREIQVLRE